LDLLGQMAMFLEERDFVGVGQPHLAFASLALELPNGLKPTAPLGYVVVAVRAIEGEVCVK
jgi:hypothetical protein